MSSTPARKTMANGPTTNGGIGNGPTRPMNLKEKNELDALLKGISEGAPDSDTPGSSEVGHYIGYSGFRSDLIQNVNSNRTDAQLTLQ